MKITYLEKNEDFDNLNKIHKLIVLDFYSDDCPPCDKLAPIYERMAELFPSILFIKAFRQNHRELALSFGVSGSPTVLFFKDGQKLEYSLSGDIEEKKLMDILSSISEKNAEEDLSINLKKIEKYDLCIIGNGPAGLSASVYASRYKINQILIGDLPGGLMTSSHKICNFPSEVEISGIDLTKKMIDQVTSLGVLQKKFSRVSNIKKDNDFYIITLSNGEVIESKTILLATGTKHKHLGLYNEESFVGKGVSYCATCDAYFYENKVVAVIGGSDSANTAALYLSEVAKKVYQIYRGGELRGDLTWIDQVKANKKIEVVYNTNVVEIIGDKQVASIRIDKELNGSFEIPLDGIFIEVGSKPDRDLIDQLSLKVDINGYIETEPNQMTSQSGVWAAGDITTNSDGFRQIITACSEGSIAAQSIFKYLQANKINN